MSNDFILTFSSLLLQLESELLHEGLKVAKAEGKVVKLEDEKLKTEKAPAMAQKTRAALTKAVAAGLAAQEILDADADERKPPRKKQTKQWPPEKLPFAQVRELVLTLPVQQSFVRLA